MKKLAFVLAGVLVVTGCGKKSTDVIVEDQAAAVDEGVILVIDGEVIPEGLIVEEDFSAEMKSGEIKIEVAGQETDGTLAFKETKKTRSEGLGDGKYRYTVIEDRKKEQATMMGQEQPSEDEVSPLVGKTMIVARNEDGTFSVDLESGDATEELEEEFADLSETLAKDMDAKIYGTVPRKVGDEWEAEAGDMVGIENAEGSFKVKFEGIEDYDGERCAKLVGSIDIEGAPEGEAPEGMKMRMSGDFVIFRSIEHRTDLKNTLTGKMRMSGDMEPQPGMKMTMTMEGDLELLGTNKISKAK